MDMFSALADPTRRVILEILATQGELPATEIYKNFSVSHPAISQHLKVLRETKLVRVKRHSQQRIYQVNTDSLSELGKWVEHMEQQWHERFDRLDALLTEEKRKEVKKYGRTK